MQGPACHGQASHGAIRSRDKPFRRRQGFGIDLGYDQGHAGIEPELGTIVYDPDASAGECWSQAAGDLIGRDEEDQVASG